MTADRRSFDTRLTEMKQELHQAIIERGGDFKTHILQPDESTKIETDTKGRLETLQERIERVTHSIQVMKEQGVVASVIAFNQGLVNDWKAQLEINRLSLIGNLTLAQKKHVRYIEKRDNKKLSPEEILVLFEKKK